MQSRWRRALAIAVVVQGIFGFAVLSGCGSKKADNRAETTASDKKVKKVIKEIESNDEFTTILETSGNALLGFDLYADWCRPCHMLSPMLEKIAAEYQHRITFYKIDIDKLPDVAATFQAQAIPHVVFVRNRKALHAISGVEQREAYVRAINTL